MDVVLGSQLSLYFMPVLRRHMAAVLSVMAVVAALAAVYLYMKFDPAESVFFPRCIFHELTGLSCPGCGSQRAIHALLNLDLKGAFAGNALMVISIPFILLAVFAWLMRSRMQGLYRWIGSSPVVWTVFAVIMLWWVLRNVFGI